MIPVIILVTLAVFLLLFLTGDPIRATIGIGADLTPEQIEIQRHKLGFDRPLYIQYFSWLGNVLQGDFGRSNYNGRPVLEEIGFRIPVTLQLGLLGWLFSVVIAIPAGIISSVRRGTRLDTTATIITISGLAVPNFWLGIMLILVFSVTLGWLPSVGFVSIFEDPIRGLRYLALPAFSLGVALAAANMRQTRSAMLEVLAQDYIRTARAKGLSEGTVIWVHALKNAMLPVVTLMGLQIGMLFGGTVVIERLFGIPGVGRLVVDSVFKHDFPVVQGFVLIAAVVCLLANLAADLVYAYLDPRIRYK